MSSLDQMSLLRGLSGQVAISSPLPSLAFHSSPLSPTQSSPDTESLSDSSSPANDSEEISLAFSPTNHQRLLQELNNSANNMNGSGNSNLSAGALLPTTSAVRQQTVFGLDLPYTGHSYPYDIHSATNSSTATSTSANSVAITPSTAPASLIANIPLLRNNSFGEQMALEPTSLAAASSSTASSSASSSNSAASITASLLASAAAQDLFSSLNLPALSATVPFNSHHLPTDSPLHLLGAEKKVITAMDVQIPNIQNNKIDTNDAFSSLSSSSSSHKRSRNERSSDVSSSKDKDKDSSDEASPGGEFDKKMEHRERHRLLDANRRSREAAAVLILQKYAYPDGSKDSSGKLIKNPDKVSVLQRSGNLLQQLTEQNANFATQLHSTLASQQQLRDEKEKMKTEMQQLRDRLAALEIERGDLRQRLQHAAQITNKMQERLVSVSNAAAAAAANATQTKLLPLISEISGKDESQIASAASAPQTLRMETPVSLPMFNQNNSMSLYESLFINSSIVMLAVNMQGILVAANKGMQRFLAGMNITYDDIIGRPICPFAARPGFAQIRLFLRMQQDREAARLKSAEAAASAKADLPDINPADALNQSGCPLSKVDSEITFESTATAPVEDEGKASPAPAYFARPYPHTAKSMAMLFSGREQMVTSTHRWLSKSGHTWEMQMTSYLVTENGMPSYCVGLTSDDHIVQIS